MLSSHRKRVWRRLWRRRLRRRPLLPFLLAAALAVDAVVLFGLHNAPSPGAYSWWTLLLGVMMGQANLLGFWVGVSRRGVILRSIVAFLGVGGLAALVERVAPDPPGIFVAFLMVSLAASAMIGGVVHWFALALRQGLRPRGRRRYTIGLLLLLMTVVPLIALVAREGRWNVLLEWRVAGPALLETSLVTVLLVLSKAIRSTVWLAVVYFLLGAVGFLALNQDSPNNVESPLYYFGLLIGVGGFLLGVRADFATLAQQTNDLALSDEATETHDESIERAEPAATDKTLRYDAAHPSVLKMHIDLKG